MSSSEAGDAAASAVPAEAIAHATGGEATDAEPTAEQLLGEGRRHVLCDNPQEAADCFGHACEILAQEKGDLADELGDPYLEYGRALLEVIRKDNAVLGNKLAAGAEGGEQDEETSDGEEGSEVSPEVAASVSAAAEALDKHEAEKNDDGDSKKEGEEEGEDIGADNEDASDMMVAWEILDSARVIFSRLNGKENEYKLAETYECIGEYLMEKGESAQAIEEYEKALDIYQRYEAADSRLVAMLHYSMGMAHSMCMATDRAIQCYESSVACLKLKVESLNAVIQECTDKTSVEEAEKSPDTDAVATLIKRSQSEIEQINSVLPDLLSKIEDQRSVAPLNQKTQEELYKTLMKSEDFASSSEAAGSKNGNDAASGDAADSNAPRKTMSGQMNKANTTVSNIQHLVRKRKAEPEEADKSGPQTKDEDTPAPKRIKPTPVEAPLEPQAKTSPPSEKVQDAQEP